MNIAIDGPAGAGKSTIAKKAAEHLGSVYVDTGAMYRAIGLYMLQNGISMEEEDAVLRALDHCDIDLRYLDGTQHIFLNGNDVSTDVRKEEVGKAASIVSKIMPVRERLVDLQRIIASKTSVVMDGRDIGTVVLPDAELKIYLTASSHVRALRRYEELRLKNAAEVPDLASIERDIRLRDEQDMNREHSPLRKADDAVEVDSSEMTIDEVTNYILRLASEKEGLH
ncbi:MAG: (d)CMP kinase [Lachnospiraceae bacterium]|nr:(d)CMP kinase [Lachnospiraceae bacterium]